jgi:hypothetical protein
MEQSDQRTKQFSLKPGERRGKKRVVCYIPINLAIQIKEYAWQKRQTVTDYVVEALLSQVKQDNKKEIL